MNLDIIKQQLQNRLYQLQQRAQNVQRDLQQPHSADWQEQAQERENDEVLESIAAETGESVEHLQAALKRIEEGCYGLCAACGEPINKARLTALPEATLCVDCASH